MASGTPGSVVEIVPIKTGYLTKQGGSFKSWKRRYFILSDKWLKYYASDKQDAELKGTIYLADITGVKKEGKGHMFQLESELRTFFIRAETALMCSQWLDVIRTAVMKVTSIDVCQATSRIGHESYPHVLLKITAPASMAERVFDVDAEGASIGSRDNNKICIQDAAHSVSRQHCRVLFSLNELAYYLEDLGSANGTYAQGGRKLIPGENVRLSTGDVIRIGQTISMLVTMEGVNDAFVPQAAKVADFGTDGTIPAGVELNRSPPPPRPAPSTPFLPQPTGTGVGAGYQGAIAGGGYIAPRQGQFPSQSTEAYNTRDTNPMTSSGGMSQSSVTSAGGMSSQGGMSSAAGSQRVDTYLDSKNGGIIGRANNLSMLPPPPQWDSDSIYDQPRTQQATPGMSGRPTPAGGAGARPTPARPTPGRPQQISITNVPPPVAPRPTSANTSAADKVKMKAFYHATGKAQPDVVRVGLDKGSTLPAVLSAVRGAFNLADSARVRITYKDDQEDEELLADPVNPPRREMAELVSDFWTFGKSVHVYAT